MAYMVVVADGDRFELSAYGFKVRCSHHLSYPSVLGWQITLPSRLSFLFRLVVSRGCARSAKRIALKCFPAAAWHLRSSVEGANRLLTRRAVWQATQYRHALSSSPRIA